MLNFILSIIEVINILVVYLQYLEPEEVIFISERVVQISAQLNLAVSQQSHAATVGIIRNLAYWQILRRPDLYSDSR